MTHDVDAPRVLSPRRRGELLDRLADLYLAHGFAAFTVDDLALRLHCSTGTLHALAPDVPELTRVVLVHFFSRSSERAEARAAAVSDAGLRPGEYLAGLAEALAPAGNAFFRDLERCPAGRQVYEQSTRLGADRVRELLREGVRAGRVRDVQASFVGDTVAVVAGRISSGALLLSTGLDDARAYAELAALVTDGVSP